LRTANVIIVGANGLVGLELVRVLEEWAERLPVGMIRLVASDRSAGRTVEAFGQPQTIVGLSDDVFAGADFAFFATPNDVSARFVPIAAAAGATVIDKSSQFRLTEGIPLVVPELNIASVRDQDRVIANPNCSTIQLVLALGPLERLAPIRRATVCTYQSVSGTGRDALQGLERETRAWAQGEAVEPQYYAHPIAFNVLAQCDGFAADGFTREEHKLRHETRKILDRPDLRLAATAVRVPVRVGHAEAVTVEFSRPVTPEEARAALAAQLGVLVVDDPSQALYPTPRAAEGRDEVFVGRVRQDPDDLQVLHLFVVADNLRKGAALNAVQIAEALWQRRQ